MNGAYGGALDLQQLSTAHDDMLDAACAACFITTVQAQAQQQQGGEEPAGVTPPSSTTQQRPFTLGRAVASAVLGCQAFAEALAALAVAAEAAGGSSSGGAAAAAAAAAGGAAVASRRGVGSSDDAAAAGLLQPCYSRVSGCQSHMMRRIDEVHRQLTAAAGGSGPASGPAAELYQHLDNTYYTARTQEL